MFSIMYDRAVGGGGGHINTAFIVLGDSMESESAGDGKGYGRDICSSFGGFGGEGLELSYGEGPNLWYGWQCDHEQSGRGNSDACGQGDGDGNGYTNGYAFLQISYTAEAAYGGGSEGGGGDGLRDGMGNGGGFGNSYANGGGRGDGDGNGYTFSYGHTSLYGCIGNSDNG